MNKYFTVFRQSFSQFTSYRIDVLLSLLQSFIPPALMIAALFFAVPIGGINISGLVSYYILISLVYPITISKIDEEIGELTVSGQINTFLLQPLSLIRWLYSKNLSEKLVMFITLLPLIAPALVLSDLTLTKTILFLLSLLLCYSLSFSLSYLIGLFCFWVDEFWAIHNVKHVTIQLLGGVIVPYSFFPENVTRVLGITPFSYLVRLPVSALRGTTTATDFLVVSIWIAILLFIARIFQARSISKYSFTAS